MKSVRHVILTTYGEPPEAAFVDQLVYSWRILLGLTRTIAPIPRLILPVVALSRGRQRTRMWKDEGYSSPLEPITGRQARALRQALLAGDASHWQVHVAYEFRRPLVADVLANIPTHETAVVIPMYAAESDFTHALSRTAVRDWSRLGPWNHVSVLPAFDADTLGALSAEHVRRAVTARTGWQGPDVALVLAAHGTLLEPSRPIDTGLAATLALRDAIRTRLAGNFGMIVNGWLNHTRGGRWTKPPIDEALRQVTAAGFTRVVYYPYGFLADNAESQLEGRIALRGEPGLEALHLDCLNDSPLLIETMARAVTGTGNSRALDRESLCSA